LMRTRSSARRCALAATVVAALTTACANHPAERRPPPNVLLITVDTLRADALSAYGSHAVATPWIDRLAAGGARFTQARASAVVTLPSHATILSGLYPFRHGVRENAGFRFPAQVETLATQLRARHYRTGAFVSAFPLDARFGLTRGFDVYDDRFSKNEAALAFRVPERRGADTVAAALAWIGHDTAPWFAWVHVYEPHFPYAPPEPFASQYRGAPYLGEVAAVDSALGPLLQPMLDPVAGRDTLIVLTADHGESLGEHGEMTHGLFAYDATLRVPLILYEPHRVAARVVSEPVRHRDNLPTVLDAIDGTPPAGVDGRSLLPIAGATAAAVAPAAGYFESLSASINRGWAPLYGVTRGSLKYIDLPIPELYDTAADPAELHDLTASRPAEARELERLLAVFKAGERAASPSRENADTRDRLRSLGYLASAAPAKTHFTDADDPKRLVGLDHQIEEVVSRYQRGDLRGAIALGEQLVQRRPDMPISLVHLAFLYNEAGEHSRAVGAIRRALALNPAANDVAALAGAYLTEAGRAADTVALLAPYTRAPDPDVDVLIAYGVALATVGRTGDALDAFNRARAADPASGLPLLDAGTVLLMGGDNVRAAASFTEALAIDPTLARAHNGLGVIDAERKNYDSALAHWRRAVELDPHDFQTLFNIGDLLIKTGQPAQARPYWERYLAAVPPGAEVSDRARVERWLSKRP
jgi:arylsulfatase A-like enzyme/Tfp pilus assembly protein PilF